MSMQRVTNGLFVAILMLLLSSCANHRVNSNHHSSYVQPKAYHKHVFYPHCAPGGLQSPINIPQQIWRDDEAKALQFSFTASADHLINAGNTIKVLFYGNHNALTIGSERYYLQEIYMSIPAETHVLGQRYPMEWHFLYRNNAGETVIVASLVMLGASNPDMAILISQFPHRHNINSVSLHSVQFSGDRLVPTTNTYYTFIGSLDFPPCTPNVRWYVMKQPITASIAQVNEFRKYFKNNARAIQALNGRKVITNG